MSIPAALRQLVWDRANGRCEYCRMPQKYDPATFEVDHIVPEKMAGKTVAENLALACFKCNNHKGPNIAGIDPETGERAFLYDPRKDTWSDHFQWIGPLITGVSPSGRATVALLEINAAHRLAHRRQLFREGVFRERPDDLD